MMHFRLKGVKRSDERIHVGGEEIKRDSNMQQAAYTLGYGRCMYI